jgi:hypothetical protein
MRQKIGFSSNEKKWETNHNQTFSLEEIFFHLDGILENFEAKDSLKKGSALKLDVSNLS